VYTNNPVRTQAMDVLCRNHVTVVCCQGCLHGMACASRVSLVIIQRTPQKSKAGGHVAVLRQGAINRME
jgi:hypothetical protein